LKLDTKAATNQVVFPSRSDKVTATHEVLCIKKSNRTDPHERITDIGGRNADGTAWGLTQAAAIQGIENGSWKFYISDGGRHVDVIVALRNGKKYLKTTADGEQPNNLLSQPECK
jgi:hypothetical protein